MLEMMICLKHARVQMWNGQIAHFQSGYVRKASYLKADGPCTKDG